MKTAKEATRVRRYRPGEDLFWYCFSLTLRERLHGIRTQDGEGYVKVLLAEGLHDVEDAMKLYESRLEETKETGPPLSDEEFILFLSE